MNSLKPLSQYSQNEVNNMSEKVYDLCNALELLDQADIQTETNNLTNANVLKEKAEELVAKYSD